MEVSFIDVYVDCNFWLGLTINNVCVGFALTTSTLGLVDLLVDGT
jgi:hypothetical protein